MKNLSLPEVSMEAISYQGRSMLLFDLISAIETFRAHVSPTQLYSDQFDLTKAQSELDRLNLTGIVEKRTGMRVAFLVNDEHTINCVPPLLDANNPFFRLLKSSELIDSRKNALERNQRALRMAQDVRGWVDLKSAKVGGVFSTLNNRIYLGTELLVDHQFTSEEVAAMVLHELGHLFSYFETLGYTTAVNMVINTAVEALREVSNDTQRYQLISQAASAFHVKPDAEVFEEKNDDTVKVLLLKTIEQAQQDRVAQLAAGRERRYNYRSIEFMADQYAARMGAAMPLASARHKMAKLSVVDYGRSRAGFIAFQAARMALLAAAFVVPTSVVVGPLVLFSCTFLLACQAVDEDGRDDPSESLGRVSRDLVQVLKNPKLDPKLRKELLADLDALSSLREEVQEHHGIIRYIYRNVLPTGRRQAKVREIQKSIEDLVNNNLFVHASRLRSA